MDFSGIERFVREKLGGDHSGHDVFHCLRVKRMAERLARHEPGCDLVVVGCAALLHDVPDVKLCDDVEQAMSEVAAALRGSGVDARRIEHVLQIIDSLSFKGFHVDTTMATVEGKVVQDADRLDALGAVGIARCFAYGGRAGRAMHDPDELPEMHESEAAYRASKGSSVAHFHEKLLVLRDRMQTAAGRRLAAERHAFMEAFLRQFLAEWDGVDADGVADGPCAPASG